ncbi:hypothetical protein ABIB26_002468 [Arthrobacter sp. UYEF20]
MFADAVARQDTITQLIAVIRRFGKAMEHGATLMAVHATSYDYSYVGVDPEARHAHKSRSVMMDGFKGHIIAGNRALHQRRDDPVRRPRFQRRGSRNWVGRHRSGSAPAVRHRWPQWRVLWRPSVANG